MKYSKLSLHGIESIKVVREEFQTTIPGNNKMITIEFIIKDNEGNEFVITAFSKSHDNWTDATKELNFNRMFPNNIIIEHTDEDPFREPLVATQVTEQEPF